jgi:putative phosphoribosyl transferase
MLINIPLVDSFGNSIVLGGYLTIPDDSEDSTTNIKKNSLVIFVHGSGSSKDSPRNQYLSQILNKIGIGTFLFDLLTKEEEESDNKIAKVKNQIPGLTLNKFNISLLADRLIKVTNFIIQIPELGRRREEKVHLNIGYFGASTGVAAAVYACEKIREKITIKTIVSRGGRPDLISSIFNYDKKMVENINIPLLFIIGKKDKLVLDWTKNFIKNNKLVSNSKIEIIKNASHLFEEEGTLEKAGDIVEKWFIQYL